MLILTHVIIALLSIAYSTYLFIAPSVRKLQLSYGLVIATLASGSYLVLSTHSPMLPACELGLVYTSLVLVVIGLARRKLKTAKIIVSHDQTDHS